MFARGLARFTAPTSRSVVAFSRNIALSCPAFGRITFKLAELGEGIAEVEVLKFHLKEGDVIEEMDAVCEVQSDKAAVEISSRFSGKVLKIVPKVGDMIRIGSPLIELESDDVEGAAAPAAAEKATPAAAAASTSAAPTGEAAHSRADVKALPSVRKLAREMNLDLTKVVPTGKSGIITKEDVLNFKSGATPAATPAASAAPSTPTTPTPAAPKLVIKAGEDVVVPLRGFPKAMAKSMTESVKVPHMNLTEEINMTNLIKMREGLKPILAKDGLKVTITPFIVKALSAALKKYPILNSKFQGEQYTVYGAHNVSLAIDTPSGLVVPCVKNVESMSVMEVQQDMLRIQKLATENKLKPADLTGGTICISNVGVIGGTHVNAILFDGQAVIVALGRVQKKLSVEMEELDVMNITISADHRHLDGATVARFATEFRNILENPALLLLQ